MENKAYKVESVKLTHITLGDNMTKWGWRIRDDNDLITALYGYPVFDTVYSGFMIEAIKNSGKDKRRWKDVKELGNHILGNYV